MSGRHQRVPGPQRPPQPAVLHSGAELPPDEAGKVPVGPQRRLRPLARPGPSLEHASYSRAQPAREGALQQRTGRQEPSAEATGADQERVRLDVGTAAERELAEQLDTELSVLGAEEVRLAESALDERAGGVAVGAGPCRLPRMVR